MEKLKYSMVIQWSDEYNDYIVTSPELPGFIAHGSSYEDAVREAQDTMRKWLMVVSDFKDHPPEPWKYVSGD